jgi:NB-ARC domain
MRLFGRQDELAKLATWIGDHRSFMFYGPAGVGKTRLLDELVPRLTAVLRVSSCNTPQAIFQELASALWKKRQPDFRDRFKSVEQLKHVNSVSMKGLCLNALKSSRYTLVLEHVGFSSQQLAASVKHIANEAGLPLIFVARSCHMEDVGYLVRHFPGSSERLELTDFKTEQAEEFSKLVADEVHLEAENRSEFLNRLVEFSGGNPGAIVAMAQMACTAKYRSGDCIKSTPLYIDFRIARNAMLSLP